MKIVCRLLLVLAALLLFITSAPARQGAVHTAPYAKFHGAWFDIDYPVAWKATPFSRSATSTTGSDSARFASPDGRVEFYVFSPQWNGNPKEIALDPKREILVYHRVAKASRGKMTGGGYLTNNVAKWYTVRAKDHSYERSWVDVEDKGSNVRHVFGIKYRNQAAYQKYRTQYSHFCKSLVQYAD